MILLCVFAVTALPYGCLVFLGHHTEKKAAIAYQSRSCSGAVVSFGSYPQTQVTDKEVLSGLNALTLNWKYYKDCFAGQGYYSTMEQTNCMKYADINYNGNRYRAVMIEQFRPDSILHSAIAEESRQDDNGYLLNTVYWFLFEPIQWIVLDGQSGEIATKYILDAMPFNNSFYWIDRDFDKTPDIERELSSTKYLFTPANLYKTSSIRFWLNHNFTAEAFTTEEKKAIKTNGHFTYESDEKNKYGLLSLNYDRVFLLSFQDVLGYQTSKSETAIQFAPVTDYARCRGAFTVLYLNKYFTWHWLCSPGNHCADVISLYINDEKISYDRQFFYAYSLGGVRCATNLKKSFLQSLLSVETIKKDN